MCTRRVRDIRFGGASIHDRKSFHRDQSRSAARVLFGGCAVKSADATDLGFVGDADLAHWPDAMRALQKRYASAAIVVPGHGDPGDGALLQHTLDLLAPRDAASGRGEGGSR